MTDQDRRELAELEAARAKVGEHQARVERDVATYVAANESAVRAAAEDAAYSAESRAQSAEAQARSMATSASMARSEAAYERAASENNAFGAILVTFALVAVFFVLGYYLWYQPSIVNQPSQTIVQRTEKTTERAVPIAVPSAPAPSVPSQINVHPPDVNVRVEQPAPPPPQSDPGTGSDSGGSSGTDGGSTGGSTDGGTKSNDSSVDGG